MTDKQKNIYVCPMHPDVRQEGPGRCSVCQMELVAEKEEEKE